MGKDALKNQIWCDCSRPITRDPITGMAVHRDGTIPICEHCHRCRSHWKKSKDNPDNFAKVKERMDTVVNTHKGAAWTSWPIQP